MGRRRKQRGRALDRERARRRGAAGVEGGPSRPVTRREGAARCGWCDGPIEIKSVGRIPKWCSASCRQRAWEQRRAAASGRAAVEVVERAVHVPVERVRAPRHEEWLATLQDLASQLESGRIYARELPELGAALAGVLAAYRGRR